MSDYPHRFAPPETSDVGLRSVVRTRLRERWRAVHQAASGDGTFLPSGFSAVDLSVAVISRWEVGDEWRAKEGRKLDAITRAVAERPSISRVWQRHLGPRLGRPQGRREGRQAAIHGSELEQWDGLPAPTSKQRHPVLTPVCSRWKPARRVEQVGHQPQPVGLTLQIGLPDIVGLGLPAPISSWAPRAQEGRGLASSSPAASISLRAISAAGARNGSSGRIR